MSTAANQRENKKSGFKLPDHPSLAGVSKPTLEKLARLSISRSLDLVLHLPIRYEDETHVYPIKDALSGQTVQVEGVVVNTEIQYRPRRTLVCQIEDAGSTLVMRLLNFYGSQVKALAPGTKVRLLGEIRQGFSARKWCIQNTASCAVKCRCRIR